MSTDPTPASPDAAPDGTPAATPATGWPILSAEEARVLGALVEKQLTTPDYYPLTLNALVAACNQKNNRDPVLHMDDAAALAATDTLREKKLVWQVFLAGTRVPKYRHAFTDVYHVAEESVPLLCELLLRGPQTVGELRTRCERMRPYADTAAVETLLQELAAHREGPFVVKLPREPGRREPRYAQLLGGPVAASLSSPEAPVEPARAVLQAGENRIARLEQTVEELQARVLALETKWSSLL
jgi:uncharacterized protein YceH (UPF0502 family)